MSIDVAPDNSDDVRSYVRTLTDYDDVPDELPQSALADLVDIAQLRLYNKTGSDSFYTDPGLGQALVGVTAILAKARVENYTIEQWSVGDQTIVVGDSDTEDLQLQQWNSNLVLEGLDASSSTSSGADGLRNTSSYIGN